MKIKPAFIIPAFIIAEVGSNWRKYEDPKKNWDVLIRQIVMAKDLGADAVKFQLFTAHEIYGPKVRGTKFEANFDKFALPVDWLPDIHKACVEAGIEFMCSAFSVDGLKAVDPFVARHKLASPEATHKDMVQWLMTQPKPVIYSDGCVEKMDIGRYQDVRLTCVSKYPSTTFDYDLKFQVACEGTWGVSDHTFTDDLALMARSRGATYFEKHVDFCYDEGSDTPDKVVSIDALTFAKYVFSIRDFDPDKTAKLKQKCNLDYARVKTEDGWFRPIPEAADLTKGD